MKFVFRSWNSLLRFDLVGTLSEEGAGMGRGPHLEPSILQCEGKIE